ncbi:MmgE/PrpD family protein [Pseudorhodobacter sp. E13]|uniref:MmgE/PrpD family protein n=1 Tax=Pseudorhodobacter sp. E13 TaxID=2487931 RepID=UPI000F8D9EFF|nr:MmgE/PrpD family protein [Pseudorhodobacter sp. E13]RUS64843.1 MmgE/PrpD family protein [Pseudorhodobacter sp. E13]
MTNATQTLLSGLWDIQNHPLSDKARQDARLRLLDYLGCTLAGAEMERSRMMRLVAASGAGAGPARLIGLGLKTAPALAALVNGTNAHVAELDDGNRFGMVHPGAPVISAVLAQAQASGLSDEDILLGIVVGYEAAVRLARAVQPDAKDAGLHATGICGTVGAAMGVAAALRLDKAGMNAALAGGTTAASGLLKVIRGASQLKPFNAGHAAQAGLSAALMAVAGFAGPADVLDGEHGYLHVMSGKPDKTAEALVGTGTLCVGDVYVKPYASCRHCHAPVEAALILRQAHGLTPDKIAKVAVSTHRMAVHLHDHTEITGVHSAKMSVNYCVAAALITGQSGMAAFTPEHVADPEILDLTRRVDVRADPELTALVPAKRAAVVEIHCRDGQILRDRIDLPKGEPETALTAAEFETKFLDLAGFAGLDATKAAALADRVLNPGQAGSLLHSIDAL